MWPAACELRDGALGQLRLAHVAAPAPSGRSACRTLPARGAGSPRCPRTAMSPSRSRRSGSGFRASSRIATGSRASHAWTRSTQVLARVAVRRAAPPPRRAPGAAATSTERASAGELVAGVVDVVLRLAPRSPGTAGCGPARRLSPPRARSRSPAARSGWRRRTRGDSVAPCPHRSPRSGRRPRSTSRSDVRAPRAARGTR